MEIFEFLMQLAHQRSLVLFLLNLLCIYLAVKGSFARAFGVTILTYLAIYSIALRIVMAFLTPIKPSNIVLDFTKDPTAIELAPLPIINVKIIMTIVGMMIVVSVIHYAIEYAMLRYFYPNNDNRRLRLFVLCASLFSSLWLISMDSIDIYTPHYKAQKMKEAQEDEKKRFIDALERGAITLRIEDKNLIATFHEPFHTHSHVYDGSSPGYYVEGTMPKYLQDIAKEYVKKSKRSR